MKYIILIIIAGLVIFIKPWELSLAGIRVLAQRDTTLASSSEIKNTYRLFSTNQVINNNDSELENTKKFDDIIQKFLNKWDIKGASFALMKDNHLIYCKGYGFADLEANIPMDVKNVFRIASVSKLITAVAIMKLQEEGKLHLSDPVFGNTGILNDSIYGNIKDPRTTKITVEHLLRHQGGFTIANGDPMFCPVEIANKMNTAAPADLTTMIRFVISRKLRFTPGDGTSYSNIGYGILSKVIEKISKQDYEAYVRKNILLPAGCFEIHLGKNLYADKLPNEVKYYEVTNAEQIPACDGSGKLVARSNGGNNIEDLYGAGGWVASPSELTRFLSTIDNDPTIPDILTPASIEYMTSYVPNTLPIGWIDVDGKGEWVRTGTLAGTSALMKKQADGYAWVFITNTSSWQGAHFPYYINQTIQKALSTVKEWPERDLFEMQNFNHQKLLVVR